MRARSDRSASPALSGDAPSEMRFSSSFRGSSLTSYFPPFVRTPKPERRQSPRDSPSPRSPCGLRRAGGQTGRPTGRGAANFCDRVRCALPRAPRGPAPPRPAAPRRPLGAQHGARPLAPRPSRRGPPGPAAPRAAVALRRGPFSAWRARGRRRCQAAGRRTTALLLLPQPEPGQGAAEGQAAARRGESGASGRKAPCLPAETPRRLVRRPGQEERREEGRRRRGRARVATPRRRDATVAYRPRLRSARRRRLPAGPAPRARRSRGGPAEGTRQGQAASPGAWRRERSAAPPARPPPPHPAPRAAPPPPRAAAAPRSARVLLPRTSLAASGERLLPLAAALREVGRPRRAIGRASCVYTRRSPIRGISARGAGRKGGAPDTAAAARGGDGPRPAGAGKEALFAGLRTPRLTAAAPATEPPSPTANSGRGAHRAAPLRRSSPGPTRQRGPAGKRLEAGAACRSRSENANGKR